MKNIINFDEIKFTQISDNLYEFQLLQSGQLKYKANANNEELVRLLDKSPKAKVSSY